MIDENPQREFALKLDRLPEEVPTEEMEAYLSKYVKNPKMEITVRDLSEHGLRKVEIGEATVTHKGLRRAIPRMVWVGPGVRARVTSMTEKPWDSYKVIFSLCKGDVHKAWDFPNRPTVSAVRLQRISLQIVRTVKRAGNTDTCQKDAPLTRTAVKTTMKTRKKKRKMPTRSPRKLTSKKDPQGRRSNQSIQSQHKK